MLSRRSFVWLSSLSGAAALSSCAPVGRTDEAVGTSLPPAIAALTSMRDQAQPITAAERLTRAERARTLMAGAGIDALMLTSGTSMVYFANVQWSGGERLFAVVIPVKGEPFAVCPAFEEERAREQLALGPFTGNFDVRTWQEHENPYELVAQGLRDRGIVSGRVGIEETTKHAFSDGVAAAAPALRLVSGTAITAGCRMVKDAHELELMRLASHVTWQAYKAAYDSLEEGMTQNDFGKLVSAAHTQLGFSGSAGVQTGEYSALPHGSVQPQVVREGTILLIDGGCKVEGYSSDISRTFVLGTPTQKMRDVFDIERRAQDAALAAAAPGVECQAVDAAARKVIVDAGYGPDYEYFTHRVGHGMGMDGHEWPYLVRGNSLPLAPGMTFSDEPGIYIRGEFGVRLEDDMVITETGAELFTPQSESLEKPF
ncbi:MAG: aminopeptidase P family protein [Acidobacteria bacterium]|jgi:Xaa-Pro dipeptidase|nr:aminopeptidase P family protein [Acidobacteriota bacterium]